VAQPKPKTDDPAIGLYFKVTIDDHDLGSFTSCKGLSFAVAVEPVEEGGNNGFVHMLPGRITYSNVTFTRAINRDSAKLARWFASMNGQISRTTASITALSADGDQAIATWTLQGVIPVRWTGPDLDAERGGVATESFEIAHHGFLEV
jgi:phage tail-like protein